MLLRRLQRMFLWFVVVVGIAACSAPQASQPAPTTLSSPPVANQPRPTATPMAVPTPSSDMAVVYGVLQHYDGRDPISTDQDGVDLFLAQVLRGEQEGFALSSLDKQSAPSSVVAPDGKFVFSKVPPGEYVISVVSPMSEVLARSADNVQLDKVFTVEAGQTLDLGTLVVKIN